ncbi:MAG: DNA-3-methyladenine glycosylase II [Acidimicrobiales bacterium]|jgi:DNA-3-methyladenine glycosylase II
MTPAQASNVLATTHPAMAAAVQRFGPARFGSKPKVDQRFPRLARSITGQQLSVRAAGTIFGRLENLLGPVTPEAILGTNPDELRACGLSGAKVAALVDLASRTESGALVLESLGRRPEEEVIAALTAVRGIGRWTAQMFLLGSLHRLDVWPTGDAGVRNGFARMMGLPSTPTAEELELLGDAFRPYRSVLAWYCWQAIDADPNG